MSSVKKSKWKKVVLIVLIVLAVLAAVGFAAFRYLFGDLKINKITEDTQELGISSNSEYRDQKITNIAIFGLDQESNGRTDSLMVLTVDSKENQVKLTSILRDSYVSIEGHGNEKINHAYAYGGPTLAIKTLNQNFGLDIKDYISSNFTEFIKMVDTIGGIDISITAKESSQIRGLGGQSGMVHLNGQQALDYSRIRYIDSDNARADRQRKVLECMFNQIKNTNPSKYVELIKTFSSTIETSLDYNELWSYSQLISNVTLKQNVVPGNLDNPIGTTRDGAWVWVYDISAASNRLLDFIYHNGPGNSTK